ncbi:hypothetical protein SISNIDRAFT_256587 [Sistotremastrum niveocremeum HHB9708]|uniref:Uncharacterized protein n=2 Tax=Sistotremastraceae TaxID=3402574 RepID=A0A164PHM3_9AGAM|nr:hypothetical protein SISNIDRAFT_256587 [Sistotremastrum niveocremeum HHB9708]KZT34148.1 hypothetical protein SISSUDRAFT_313048 [Sistotremastrum suecicum HHB10207 ss-3]
MSHGRSLAVTPEMHSHATLAVESSNPNDRFGISSRSHLALIPSREARPSITEARYVRHTLCTPNKRPLLSSSHTGRSRCGYSSRYSNRTYPWHRDQVHSKELGFHPLLFVPCFFVNGDPSSTSQIALEIHRTSDLCLEPQFLPDSPAAVYRKHEISSRPATEPETCIPSLTPLLLCLKHTLRCTRRLAKSYLSPRANK